MGGREKKKKEKKQAGTTHLINQSGLPERLPWVCLLNARNKLAAERQTAPSPAVPDYWLSWWVWASLQWSFGPIYTSAGHWIKSKPLLHCSSLSLSFSCSLSLCLSPVHFPDSFILSSREFACNFCSFISFLMKSALKISAVWACFVGVDEEMDEEGGAGVKPC